VDLEFSPLEEPKTQDEKQLYLRGTTRAEQTHRQIYTALELSPEILKTKKTTI
jgi:hypothetical protein